jgi:ferredoxin
MRITFEAEGFQPVEVPEGSLLGDVLDGPHSPVFFGCKSGNCGTCLVDVNSEAAALLPPPSDDERDLVEAHAPDRPHARLACQLKASCDLNLRYLN